MWDMIGVFLNDETVFKESEEELEAETEETVRPINEPYRGIPRDMIIPGAIFVYSGENRCFGAYDRDSKGLFECTWTDDRRTLVNGRAYTILSTFNAPGDKITSPIIYTLLLEPGGTMGWYRFAPVKWNHA